MGERRRRPGPGDRGREPRRKPEPARRPFNFRAQLLNGRGQNHLPIAVKWLRKNEMPWSDPGDPANDRKLARPGELPGPPASPMLGPRCRVVKSDKDNNGLEPPINADTRR
jgi:hypothetical protein